MRIILLVLFLFFLGLSSKGETFLVQSFLQDTTEYNKQDDFSLSAFPLAFFLPETGFAFGGAGILVFNIGEEKTFRKSQIQLGVAYTLKNQLLIFVPYELYVKQKLKIYGELGYYRYIYNFYGIGIDSKAENLEIYTANFPRVINTVAYRFQDRYFVGIQNKLDVFEIPSIGPLLANANPTGIQGGILSSLGVSLSYDNRDDIFYPTKGAFVELVAETAGSHTLSSFQYSFFQLDARYFFSVAKNHILGFNAFTGTQLGDSPFFNYFFLSSGKRGRGYNDRRFIDKNIALFQAEYRFPIYKRLTGSMFVSAGTLAPNYADLWGSSFKPSYGAGLRFQLSKKQKSNLRVDVANGLEGLQFYITIGEAF